MCQTQRTERNETIIFGDFNISLTVTDNTSRPKDKVNRIMEEQNNTVSTKCPKTTKYSILVHMNIHEDRHYSEPKKKVLIED